MVSGAEMEGLGSLRCAVLPSPGSDRAAGLLRGLVRFCSRRDRVGQRGGFSQASKGAAVLAACGRRGTGGRRPMGGGWRTTLIFCFCPSHSFLL
jgi:hypothetical protein